jgi:transcriptional regulator with XRE-family HTH domain
MTAPSALAQQVGARLREARLTARLTVREAAVAVGLRNHGTLVQYEHGNVLPPLDRLAALALTYRVPLASLLVSDDALIPLVTLLEQATPPQLEGLRVVLGQLLAGEPPGS